MVEGELKEIILKGLQNSLLNTFSSLKNLKNRYSDKNYEMVISISKHEKLTIYSNDDGILDLKFEDELKLVEIIQKLQSQQSFHSISTVEKSLDGQQKKNLQETL